MSINITINAGQDEPFAVEIEEFPTRISMEKDNSALEILPFILFSLVFLYFAVNIFAPTMTLIVLLAAGVAMLGLSFFLIRRSERKNVMLFEKNGVSITEAGFFKDHQWKASYGEFDGVFMRRRQAKSGRTQSVYQIIELKHPNPKKTLPLFVHKTNNAPKERWKSYGELFDLPTRREGS